ncbi:MAG: glutamate--tRNA ligase [Acidobacteria bacterium]|nr:glutamate--tRNA ligase [Acidobacteriota bacterium]MBI3470949.1 glutamate--tRNA ligase [Candidatus Solibacter usitatus]
MIRLRFAPSPTGYLHIGSARTFIFNWLYARRHGGTMILRIDDTDLERNTQASLDSIFDGLNWLGLGWDEQYRQSERLAQHRQAAEAIFHKGHAYRDFTPAGSEEKSHAAGPWLCNPGMRELPAEESDRRAAAGEPFVLRYRVPRETRADVRFADAVYGGQCKATADVEDFALLRSDGMPTYHLASCADDVDLRISHIVRGQDHLSNTFKHILIFESLGADPPRFAHLPLLVAPDGAKLSKRRHGPVVSVTTYRDAGFLPHAYVNFLCLLGWSPKDNREQMSRQELIEAFSFEGVNRANAVVNFKDQDPIDPKALWLNSQHLRSMPIEDLAPMVKAELDGAGLAVPYGDEWLSRTVDVLRARFFTLKDFATRARAYFADDFPIEPDALGKLDQPQARELLGELGSRLAASSEFSEQSVEAELRKLAAERGVKAGLLINGARAALTGQPVGPSAFAVFAAIGRERVVARLGKVYAQ